MTHVKNNHRNYSDRWEELGQSPYLEAIKKSLVIDFPVFKGYYPWAFCLGDHHPVNSFVEEFSACFTQTHLFDALLEFSKSFKLS